MKKDSNELNPTGLCQCGCGAAAPIAKKTRAYCGHVQGKPVKYIHGHVGHVMRGRPSPFRGRKHTPEARAKMSAAMRGKTKSPEHRAKISAATKGTRLGPSNSNWRGGRPYTENGYTVVKLPSDHPFYVMARRGRVFEHRLLVAEQLGRPLSSTEQVHHIDGDRSHNDIENLLFMPSFSAHMRAERLQKKLVANWAEIMTTLFPSPSKRRRRIPQHNLIGAGPIS